MRKLDPNLLGLAAQRPGIDPRCWVSFGRVDEIVFVPTTGYTVGVTFVGGPLNGEGPIACQVAQAFARPGAMNSAPFAEGDLAVVVIPEGDANAAPTIIAFVPTPTQIPPVIANGEPLTSVLLDAAHVLIDPTKAVKWSVSEFQMVAQSIKFVTGTPTQSFVRGDDLVAALGDWLTALDTLHAAIAASLQSAGFPIAAPMTTYAADVVRLRAAMQLALSQFFKAE